MLRFLSTGLASAVIVRRLFRHNGRGVAELERPPVTSLPAPQPQAQDRIKKPQPETRKPGGLLGDLKTTFSRFNADDCTTMAAALAYYTTFSLPPLLLIIISVVGLAFGQDAVRRQLQSQIESLIGDGAGAQVATMVRSAGQHSSSGVFGVTVGIIMLLFGATGVFIQLQSALNRIWHVKPDPRSGGIKNLTKRILSLGMIAGVAFLLLVSLAVSAALSAAGGVISAFLPSGFSAALLHAAEFVVSLSIIAALFAAIFKVLPDVKLEWRQVWVGAGATAILFTAGKFLIGLYLGKSAAASAYGAAGSLVIIVLWIYYASMIVLLGAEFTSVWAQARGHVSPEPGAVRFVETEERVDTENGGHS
jgi:membrane protein